jgi:hypothetical protein
MKTFSVSLKKLYGPTSVTWLQQLRKQTNASTSITPIAETHYYKPTRSHTLPTSDFSLGSLELSAPETRHFVVLHLLYWRFVLYKKLTCFTSLRIVQPSGLSRLREFANKKGIYFRGICHDLWRDVCRINLRRIRWRCFSKQHNTACPFFAQPSWKFSAVFLYIYFIFNLICFI